MEKKKELNLNVMLINEKLRRPWIPKTEEIDEVESFHCRCCGGQKYHKIAKSNGVLGPGGWARTLYYVCNNCSVLFKDPHKFSKK